MKYGPIRATVSQETIAKVTRLFNGSLEDILGELFQNARRAGASAIAVDVRPGAQDFRITIADDGCGIDDPARVIALGASQWSDAVATGEDPAGMGAFSLAGRATIIESRAVSSSLGWKIEIPADGWTGERDIAVQSAERPVGTTITFEASGLHESAIHNAVTEAAQFLPIPVSYAGVLQPRKDFLAGAVLVEEWNGSRIGIFKGQAYHRIPTVNFHGVTLYHKLFGLHEIAGGQIHARIDIGTTPTLQLVLPARKEFVENEGLSELKQACEAACYRAIAAQETHSLSFAGYERARELGIDINEAAASLRSWEPDIADSGSGMGAGSPRAIDGDEFLVNEYEAHFGQAIARALEKQPLRKKLVERVCAYEGYSWYDRLRELRDAKFKVVVGDVTHIVDDISAQPPLPRTTEAEHIELEYTIDEQGANTRESESVPADLVFTFPDGYCSDGLEDVTMAFVRSDKLDPATLVEILDQACFSAWEDGEADSWDTQHDRFRRDAREFAFRVLVGEDAAIASQFRDAVARIMWTLPKGKKIEIAFTHDSPIDVVISDCTVPA